MNEEVLKGERRGLEGRLVVVGAVATGGVPHVAARGVATLLAAGGLTPRLLRLTAADLSRLATTVATAVAAPEGAATGSAVAGGRGARHLSGRVTQRGADLIDLELHAGALLALFGLVRALLESALSDDPAALGEAAGHVLAELAPHAGTKEERLAVLPLVRRAVERAGGRRDGEVRDREPVLRVPQLGVTGEVSHHCDDGLASHRTTRQPSRRREQPGRQRRWRPCGRPSRR
ncbi:hypothetical protein FRIGORI9N_470207 [Frigoribacterium sp. 9N]|nr:hypothetical protein FRIGORI9N_470207 [Frigoribacterium sp. 9N]